jgi:thioredoxin 1
MKKLIIILLLLFPVFNSAYTETSETRQDIVNNVVILTDDNFDQHTKKGIVLIDFWAWWCGPCRIQAPIIDELASEIGQKAVIAKVDVDKCPRTTSRFRIQYIPTILIFKNGELASRMSGVQDKASLVAAIDQLQN